MAEITNTNDIPWFKLSNYDFLYDLSPKELELQILLHLQYLTYQKINLEWDPLVAGISKKTLLAECKGINDQWLGITKGDAFLGVIDTTETYEPHWHRYFENRLDYSSAISGQSVYSALFNSTLLGKKVLKPKLSDIIIGDVDLILKSDFSSLSQPEKVTIELDLKNHSNREIVSQLAALLDPWRDQLNIPEPKGIKIKRADYYDKVLEYKIIPLIDLKRWESLTGNTINHRIIINLLYPDNFKLDFSRTVMGMYQDIIDNNLRDARPKKELNI